MRVLNLSSEPLSEPSGNAVPKHGRGAIPKVASLLFDCDLEDKALEGGPGEAGQDADSVAARVRVYSEAWSHAECRLAELVADALRQRVGGSRRRSSEEGKREGQAPGGEADVADHLARRGFAVMLRTALGGRSNAECLKNLRHTFLTCTQHSWPSTQHFVVDLCFREQFEICRPTPRYAEALSVVPEVFVGTEERLLALVEVLCREMTAAFEELATPLPPWRQTAAMLTKWRPRRSQDVSLPPRSPCLALPAAAAAAAPQGAPHHDHPQGASPQQSPAAVPAGQQGPPSKPEAAGPRPSPFVAHARTTLASLSTAARNAFKPAAAAEGSGSKAPSRGARPRSSLLAASLNGGSGPLPANICIPPLAGRGQQMACLLPATPRTGNSGSASAASGAAAAGAAAAGAGAAPAPGPRPASPRLPLQQQQPPSASSCSAQSYSWADGPLGDSLCPLGEGCPPGGPASGRTSTCGGVGGGVGSGPGSVGSASVSNWASGLLGFRELRESSKRASCLLAGF